MDVIKITVIKLLAVVTAVLTDWGISIPLPVAVYTESAIDTVTRAIKNDIGRVFTSDESFDEILSALTEYGVDPVIMYFDGSYKAQSKLKKLCSVVKAGQYKGERLQRLPVIVTDKNLTNEQLEQVFFMEIENPGEVGNNMLMELDAEMLSLIEDKISMLPESISSVTKFFKAGACFAYPMFKHKNDVAGYEQFQECIDKITEINEQSKDTFGLSAQFIKALYEYKESGEPVAIHELGSAHSEIIERTDVFMYYDSNYIYMNEELFQKVTKDLKEFVGSNTLKAALVEDGLLIKGKSSTYTTRVCICNQYGQIVRPSLLRFELEKIHLAGEIDLVSYYGG